MKWDENLLGLLIFITLCYSYYSIEFPSEYYQIKVVYTYFQYCLLHKTAYAYAICNKICFLQQKIVFCKKKEMKVKYILYLIDMTIF